MLKACLRRLIAASGLAFTIWTALAAIQPASASLIGSTVTGSMTVSRAPGFNLFDPNNGFVPAGYGNSTTISPSIGSEIEFGYYDQTNTITVDLTGTGLTLAYSLPTAEPLVKTVFTLTDTAFAGLKLTDVSNSFGQLTTNLSGDVLKLTVGAVSNSTYLSATYNLLPPESVPEPASLTLLALSLSAIGVLRLGPSSSRLAA